MVEVGRGPRRRRRAGAQREHASDAPAAHRPDRLGAHHVGHRRGARRHLPRQPRRQRPAAGAHAVGDLLLGPRLPGLDGQLQRLLQPDDPDPVLGPARHRHRDRDPLRGAAARSSTSSTASGRASERRNGGLDWAARCAAAGSDSLAGGALVRSWRPIGNWAAGGVVPASHARRDRRSSTSGSAALAGARPRRVAAARRRGARARDGRGATGSCASTRRRAWAPRPSSCSVAAAALAVGAGCAARRGATARASSRSCTPRCSVRLAVLGRATSRSTPMHAERAARPAPAGRDRGCCRSARSLADWLLGLVAPPPRRAARPRAARRRSSRSPCSAQPLVDGAAREPRRHGGAAARGHAGRLPGLARHDARRPPVALRLRAADRRPNLDGARRRRAHLHAGALDRRAGRCPGHASMLTGHVPEPSRRAPRRRLAPGAVDRRAAQRRVPARGRQDDARRGAARPRLHDRRLRRELLVPLPRLRPGAGLPGATTTRPGCCCACVRRSCASPQQRSRRASA